MYETLTVKISKTKKLYVGKEQNLRISINKRTINSFKYYNKICRHLKDTDDWFWWYQMP